MLRAIGPAELVEHAEEQARSAADPRSLAQGPEEIRQVLLQAGFRPLDDGTLAAPVPVELHDDAAFTAKIVNLDNPET